MTLRLSGRKGVRWSRHCLFI